MPLLSLWTLHRGYDILSVQNYDIGRNGVYVMIVLDADSSQKKVFHKLMQAMGGMVIWGGHFFVDDDTLILDGAIRSLSLSFDNKNVEINLMDLPDIENGVVRISEFQQLPELFSMAVYAFGAWGRLRGVRTLQEIEKINGLFVNVLKPYRIDPDFDGESFLFYKDKVRITYEEAVREAIEYEKQYGDTLPLRQELVLKLPDFIQFDETGLDFSAPEDSREALKSVPERDSSLVAERIDKFHARIHVLDRLSERQIFQLTRDIKNDKLLTDAEKDELYFPIEDYEFQKKMSQIEKGFAEGKGRTYANIRKLKDNLEKEDLYPKVKQRVMEALEEVRIRCGEQEVRQIMDHEPEYMEYTQYQELMAKLAPYQDIDLSPYEQRLNKMRERLEIKEISNMLFQSPKKTRKDYIELLKNIQTKGFSRENSVTYIDNILDNVREFDKKRLAGMIQNVKQMDFDTAAVIYERIEQESFLPDLRESAMAVLSKRLKQIRMVECARVVQKLREIMAANHFQADERHYVYPVEQILKKTADPKVQKLFHTALNVYARERGDFEYPVFLVDTSKSGDGGEGMLLTPENLFYSTRLSGYKIPVHNIKSIYEANGLLNHKVSLDEINGARHKLPAAVAAEELPGWMKVLKQFIRYLQGRKVSEKLPYRKKEDTHTCNQCGCVYSTLLECCPECGYRKDFLL